MRSLFLDCSGTLLKIMTVPIGLLQYIVSAVTWFYCIKKTNCNYIVMMMVFVYFYSSNYSS